MVPRQSQSYMCTLVMQKGSLSPRVLPNGTQAIPILRTCMCTLVMQKGSLSPRVLPNGTQAIKNVHLYAWVIPPGWATICDGVNCYIRKCTIYYP